jgi:hypothetical protein
MSWLVDLQTQVRRVLPRRSGGTGNKYGYSANVVLPFVSDDSTTIPIGAIVKGGNNRVRMVTSDEQVVIGVVVGRFGDDGETFYLDSVEKNEVVAVCVAGVAKVLIEDGSGMPRAEVNDFAFPSDTQGMAAPDPTAGELAFGRFIGEGEPGDLVPLKLGGGGGGGGGPTLDDGQVEATFILPTAGDEIFTRAPYSGTITGWTLLGDDPTGDAVIDIWKDNFGSYPPTVADTITGSALPTLTNDDEATSTTLTGWTTTITAGQIIVFHVDSVAVHQRLTVSLQMTRIT